MSRTISERPAVLTTAERSPKAIDQSAVSSAIILRISAIARRGMSILPFVFRSPV